MEKWFVRKFIDDVIYELRNVDVYRYMYVIVDVIYKGIIIYIYNPCAGFL